MLFLFPPPPHLCAHLERHLLIGPRRPLLVHGAAQAVDLEAATQRRSTPGRPWAEAKVEGHRPTSRHMEAELEVLARLPIALETTNTPPSKYTKHQPTARHYSFARRTCHTSPRTSGA